MTMMILCSFQNFVLTQLHSSSTQELKGMTEISDDNVREELAAVIESIEKEGHTCLGAGVKQGLKVRPFTTLV